MGALKSLQRGEVVQYSQVFNETRHRALERITAECRAAGGNAVVGIKTSIIPFQGMQEMVMLGTASYHPSLPEQYRQNPISSDLTNEEMWNLVHMGYMPHPAGAGRVGLLAGAGRRASRRRSRDWRAARSAS